MADSNNAINNTVGAKIDAVTNTLTVTNASDTASSAARATITVGGASSADPSLNFNVGGATDFEMGIDNDADDNLKISASSSLGTTDTFIMTSAGERTMPLQPAFQASLGSSDSNVTGDGTVYTLGTNTALTEIFDQGGNFNTNGTFTAPISGRYFLSLTFDPTNPGSANQGTCRIVTSNENFLVVSMNPQNVVNAGGGATFTSALLANMDAADTTTYTITFNGNGADTTDLRNETIVSGFLVV